MLISSLIIFPALSAMQLARSFRGVILLSAVISVFSFSTGLLLSLSLPAGAMIVLVNLGVLIVCSAVGRLCRRA